MAVVTFQRTTPGVSDRDLVTVYKYLKDLFCQDTGGIIYGYIIRSTEMKKRKDNFRPIITKAS